VPLRYSHCTGLAIQAIIESKRPHSSANVPGVGFKYRHGMAAPFELIGCAQTRESGANDDYMERLAAVRDRSESPRQRPRRGCTAQHDQTPKKLAARERQRSEVD
jgi:hypothetical protein